MEKVVYALWARPADHADLGRRVRGELAGRLLDGGVRGLQVNVVDEDVVPSPFAPPAAPGEETPAAVVNLWVDSARDGARAPLDEACSSLGARWGGWVVSESAPLPFRGTAGARTQGFAQFAFLRRPAQLDPAEWRRRWQEDHTTVAIDTQSTFGYVQNLVVRPLADSPRFDAIVEECFPSEAMTSTAAFYDSGDDEALLQTRMEAMMASVSRFLDVGTDPVVWTSGFVVAPPAFRP